tara:strand:- start:24 stop:554 length:531 start_codon:yes stop_codon:yes gene_type:complete
MIIFLPLFAASAQQESTSGSFQYASGEFTSGDTNNSFMGNRFLNFNRTSDSENPVFSEYANHSIQDFSSGDFGSGYFGSGEFASRTGILNNFSYLIEPSLTSSVDYMRWLEWYVQQTFFDESLALGFKVAGYGTRDDFEARCSNCEAACYGWPGTPSCSVNGIPGHDCSWDAILMF